MRTILFLSLLFSLCLIALNITLSLLGIDSFQANPNLSKAQEIVGTVSEKAWEFGRPLLQLVIVLALGEWLVSRLGLKVSSIGIGNINIQVFIAIAIVFTFCLAALANLPGLPYLKDIVLIVIGFYFGTKSKSMIGNTEEYEQRIKEKTET